MDTSPDVSPYSSLIVEDNHTYETRLKDGGELSFRRIREIVTLLQFRFEMNSVTIVG